MTLPSGFTDMIHDLLGEEAGDFLAAMQRPPVVSVRLNSRKPGAEFPEGRPVKWCPTGFYLPERPIFTLDPLLHAGAYYVQDASSMIYREVLARLVSSSPISLLDLCAAPGGKTTAMIDAIPDGSRIVANEYVGKRAAILKENLIKWGYPNATVTNRDSSFFARSGDSFDIVAVDAPCSGEGMMRKDTDAVSQWSAELISQCASLQREIVSNAVEALKPGGYLIYSTCTFNRLENEENSEFFRDSLGLIPVDMNFPEDWGIPRGIRTDLPCYRFMPHRTEGEGLFLAVFRKQESDGITDSSLRENLGISKPRKKDFKGAARKESNGEPDISAVLSTPLGNLPWPTVDVDRETAVTYLKRESIVLPPETPRGYVVVTYKGLPLGPAKNIGARANNLYPKGWRILLR